MIKDTNERVQKQQDKFYRENKTAFTFQSNDTVEVQHKKADLQAHRALSMARLKEEKLDIDFLQLSDPQGIMNKIGTAVEPK